MSLLRTRAALAHCTRGAMAIETALVAPVLLTLALGAFEASMAVARQHELQSAASEAETIVMTVNAGADPDLETMEQILRESISLGDSQITLSSTFRCDTGETLYDRATNDSATVCGTGAYVSSYVTLDLTDTYTPIWTKFGIGSDIRYNVSRTVQVETFEVTS